MGNHSLLGECLDYFTSTPILNKVLKHCVEKYRSFGNVRGTVVLRGLKDSDIESLEGFTGKNYHGKKSVSLSVTMIQKSIDESRFSGIVLDELLIAYYNGVLKSKRKEKEDEQGAAEEFYRQLAETFENTKAGDWIEEILGEKPYLYRMLYKKYRDKTVNDKGKEKVAEKKFWREMTIWMTSLNQLPIFENKYEYISAFAAAVSGNPHYYDEGMEYTLLFYYAISDMLHLNETVSSTMTAEEKHGLLLKAGLIRDDVSNDVMVYGIRAFKERGEHLGIAGFYEQKEPVSLTLSTVIQLKSVECIGDCIYVVENPIVFAKLIKEEKSVLCVNGQPNLAVLLLLDLIVVQKEKIFYNGDFDPEGLLIAQRLKNRYPEGLLFWHYEEEDFQKALSEEEISDRRLKMLEGLVSPELVKIGEWLRIYRRAGYQENIFFW